MVRRYFRRGVINRICYSSRPVIPDLLVYRNHQIRPQPHRRLMSPLSHNARVGSSHLSSFAVAQAAEGPLLLVQINLLASKVGWTPELFPHEKKTNQRGLLLLPTPHPSAALQSASMIRSSSLPRTALLCLHRFIPLTTNSQILLSQTRLTLFPKRTIVDKRLLTLTVNSTCSFIPPPPCPPPPAALFPPPPPPAAFALPPRWAMVASSVCSFF